MSVYFLFGAGGRGRTDTWLPKRDFESRASAIPPHRQISKQEYSSINKKILQGNYANLFLKTFFTKKTYFRVILPSKISCFNVNMASNFDIFVKKSQKRLNFWH